MARDETRDVAVRFLGGVVTADHIAYATTYDERYVPHSQLVDLERQLANRELEMQTFIRRASEVPGLSAELDQVTWERDQLRKTLADRDDAIRQLQEEMNELRNAVRSVVDDIGRNAVDSAREGCAASNDEYRARMGGRNEAFSEAESRILAALEAKP